MGTNAHLFAITVIVTAQYALDNCGPGRNDIGFADRESDIIQHLGVLRD